MIGYLAGFGLLACLVGCGYVSAGLALRDLDAGRQPRAGLLWRVYVTYNRLYARRAFGPQHEGQPL